MARGLDVEQELVSTQGKLHETQAQLDTTSQELKMMQDDASSRQVSTVAASSALASAILSVLSSSAVL
jgi:hypothetical protein